MVQPASCYLSSSASDRHLFVLYWVEIKKNPIKWLFLTEQSFKFLVILLSIFLSYVQHRIHISFSLLCIWSRSEIKEASLPLKPVCRWWEQKGGWPRWEDLLLCQLVGKVFLCHWSIWHCKLSRATRDDLKTEKPVGGGVPLQFSLDFPGTTAATRSTAIWRFTAELLWQQLSVILEEEVLCSF